MATFYLARSAFTFFSPSGEERVLLSYDDILVSPPTREGNVSVLRDQVVGGHWLTQRADGGASISLAFTAVFPFGSQLEADAFAHETQSFFAYHPVGILREESGFSGGQSHLSSEWVAGVDGLPTVLPQLTDYYLDQHSVWLAITYKFTLTRPHF